MRAILEKAIRELEAAECETPHLDAEVLLAHALGCPRFDLYKNDTGYQVPYDTFWSYLERRKRREPVAYIVGYKEFWSLNIKVTPDVLIPRPETEAVVEKVLASGRRFNKILDLCTGSGCIAAALASELPMAHFVVSDISKKALDIAQENLAFAQGRVTFIQSHLFENITGRFDLIVSNPPYVTSQELEKLEPEIKNYEPRLALDGGADGLDFVRKIRQDAPRFLKPDGWLILENGPEIESWNDLSLKAANPFTEPSGLAEPKIPFSP